MWDLWQFYGLKGDTKAYRFHIRCNYDLFMVGEGVRTAFFEGNERQTLTNFRFWGTSLRFNVSCTDGRALFNDNLKNEAPLRVSYFLQK